jgi:DNA-binding NtrC family response regulator
LEKYNTKCGKEIRGLSANAESLLLEYEFPGNVRELENAIEHGVTITDGEIIDLHHLPARIRQNEEILISKPKFENLKDAKRDGSNSAEKSYIIDCLKTTKGDVREAAIIAGIDISNFYKIMKKHEIDLLNYKSMK